MKEENPPMTNTNTLADTDLRGILAAQGDNYVAMYDQVVANVDRKAVQASATSRDSRKEAWKKAIAKRDKGQLAHATKMFSSFVELFKKNSRVLTVEEPTALTPAEAKSLMAQALAMATIEENVKASREMLKARVFAAMTAQFAEDSEEFPDQVPASIDVPELGHRFAREGCGRKEPELNEQALQGFLGEALWEKVTQEVVKVERKVNFEALMKEASKNPQILEHLRSSLSVGKWKSPRFVIRELDGTHHQ